MKIYETDRRGYFVVKHINATVAIINRDGSILEGDFNFDSLTKVEDLTTMPQRVRYVYGVLKNIYSAGQLNGKWKIRNRQNQSTLTPLNKF